MVAFFFAYNSSNKIHIEWKFNKVNGKKKVVNIKG